jgi:RNA polymerase sigma-70 factor, ECF subfamily
MTGAAAVATGYDGCDASQPAASQPAAIATSDPAMDEPRPDPSPDPIETDLELVRRMVAGESEALRDFCDTYLKRLYRFALLRLRGNEDLTLEMVQSTVCSALAHLESFRGEAPLVSWLFSICRHEIHRHFRRLPNSPIGVGLLAELDQNSALDRARNERPDPEEALEMRERNALVHEILDRLPGRYGDALEWKYIDGISVREIAVRLEVSPKAAESVLTRARIAFKEEILAAGEPTLQWSRRGGSER